MHIVEAERVVGVLWVRSGWILGWVGRVGSVLLLSLLLCAGIGVGAVVESGLVCSYGVAGAWEKGWEGSALGTESG